jgi:DNA-binding transcriptional LysR family regulator
LQREPVYAYQADRWRRSRSSALPFQAGNTFDRSQLYAAVLKSHPGARKESLSLQDLAKDEWILFSNRVHPPLHDTIMDAARSGSIIPNDVHDVLTAQQAVHLVAAHVGVAILIKPAVGSLPKASC